MVMDFQTWVCQRFYSASATMNMTYPTPIPDNLHARVTAHKGEPLRGKLLVAAVDAILAAAECHVRDDAAAAVLGKDALLRGAGRRDELDVLQARGLRDLVVQPGDALRRACLCDVDLDVADLPVEVGRVDVVFCAS